MADAADDLTDQGFDFLALHQTGHCGTVGQCPHCEPEPLTCPECGATMVLRTTTKFQDANGQPRKFWGCSRFPACRASHGAHADGTPLGIPADAETKAARMAAHEAFDLATWRSGRMGRNAAYRWLANRLGLTREECHIGRFDKVQCGRVIELAEAYLRRVS